LCSDSLLLRTRLCQENPDPKTYVDNLPGGDNKLIFLFKDLKRGVSMMISDIGIGEVVCIAPSKPIYLHSVVVMASVFSNYEIH
jgi:hypothetical protein